MERTLSRIQDFVKLEASAGLVLMGTALIAMLTANSPLATIYDGILGTNIRVGIGGFEISKPALLWVNDVLMAIFLFLVGLEIKREFLTGELSSFDKAVLPVLAAAGGMAIPGLVFVALTWGTPDNLNGWTIPTATDSGISVSILSGIVGFTILRAAAPRQNAIPVPAE